MEHLIQTPIGKAFGMLTVIGDAQPRIQPNGKKARMVKVECSCGTRKEMFLGSLKTGHSVSCGCERSRKSGGRLRTHGMSNTPLFTIWISMIQRCTDRSHSNYSRYGQRGIKVCERWNSFENFASDMGPRPSIRHSIDRIDNNGDYSPENCRWALPVDQNNNRRDNRLLTAFGETMTLAQWGRRSNLNTSTIRTRLRDGWSVDRAVSIPAIVKRRLSEFKAAE